MKKTGVLLINLGTPDSTHPSDVRRYLREFLSDPRVIDLPTPLRWTLLNFFILPFRPRLSAKAYRAIWQEGSPLLHHSRALEKAIAAQLDDRYIVALGMRYGNPNVKQAIDFLLSHHVHQLIVLPLFPQYASATNGSVIAKIFECLKHKPFIPAVTIRSAFYDDPGFIQSYADRIHQHLHQHPAEFILFSYHGVPERHIQKTSTCHTTCQMKENHCASHTISPVACYRAQCYATTRLLVEKLGLNKNQFQTSFQSRLGKTPWIKPYTDHTLIELAGRGIKKIAVVCPSFVADCLETLEEIGIRAEEQWLSLGGESLELIPSLNTHDDWVKTITHWIKQSV